MTIEHFLKVNGHLCFFCWKLSVFPLVHLLTGSFIFLVFNLYCLKILDISHLSRIHLIIFFSHSVDTFFYQCLVFGFVFLCKNFTFMWSHLLILGLVPTLLNFCPENACLPQCLKKYTLCFPLSVSAFQV